MYSQYGYYVKCGSSNVNTSIKQPSCPAFSWQSVKYSKDDPSYMATCRRKRIKTWT
jgi:hypothetical protein